MFQIIENYENCYSKETLAIPTPNKLNRKQFGYKYSKWLHGYH